MILSLLALLFLCIFLAFNWFIRNYIRNDAVAQLTAYASQYQAHNVEKGQDSGDLFPDTAKPPKNRIGTTAEVFTISSGYQLIDFHENEDGSNTSKVEQIATYLKEHAAELDHIINQHVKTGQQEYYISSIQDEKQADAYAVFYIDITAIRGFTDMVNMVLFLIMVASTLISFGIAALITASVNRPVKQLTNFARQIGKGDFTESGLTYTDKEFSEMADVMNQTARQLHDYDHEQKTFFQNVSHEFRTPLMSIKCYAEGIAHGLMEPAKSSHVILNEVDRLSEMVEDLLYLSRMDNPTQKIEKQQNDLRETFGGCADRLKLQADRANIKIIYDFDANPVLFLYSEKYMSRALNNLISNALRYAKTEIRLTCKSQGNTLRLVVSDDGDGISAEDLPHIFERFYRGNDGNHGIGLSIVKAVIELHGGRISVGCDSGTSFQIEFTT